MIFRERRIGGLWTLEPERRVDSRGWFARTYCRDEFAERGLEHCDFQCSVSFNREKGTLRGMHYQKPSHPEAKLVRCARGAVYDVAVDLRRDSPTFKEWFGIELSADNGVAMYIPPGFAHGFITLRDDSELFYQMSAPYSPDAATGVRWDDPAFGIAWPLAPTCMAERDETYPDFVG